MTYLKIANRAVSSLASGVTDTATSWTLATGEGSKFPASGDFHVTCEDEIVKCTSRSGDVLTVVREQEGTTKAAHTAGKAVELRITAGVLESRTTWPSDKLLIGQGVGSDPSEIDIEDILYRRKNVWNIRPLSLDGISTGVSGTGSVSLPKTGVFEIDSGDDYASLHLFRHFDFPPSFAKNPLFLFR